MSSKSKKSPLKVIHGWEVFPNGTRKRKHWYMRQYLSGIFLWRESDDQWGPFKTFEEAESKRRELLKKGWER